MQWLFSGVERPAFHRSQNLTWTNGHAGFSLKISISPQQLESPFFFGVQCCAINQSCSSFVWWPMAIFGKTQCGFHIIQDFLAGFFHLSPTFKPVGLSLKRLRDEFPPWCLFATLTGWWFHPIQLKNSQIGSIQKVGVNKYVKSPPA